MFTFFVQLYSWSVELSALASECVIGRFIYRQGQRWFHEVAVLRKSQLQWAVQVTQLETTGFPSLPPRFKSQLACGMAVASQLDMVVYPMTLTQIWISPINRYHTVCNKRWIVQCKLCVLCGSLCQCNAHQTTVCKVKTTTVQFCLVNNFHLSDSISLRHCYHFLCIRGCDFSKIIDV